MGELWTTMQEARRLVDCYGLAGLYDIADPETKVGSIYPDRTGENVVVMVAGALYTLPWPFVSSRVDGRDFEMQEAEAETT